jgi:hypothetical protein
MFSNHDRSNISSIWRSILNGSTDVCACDKSKDCRQPLPPQYIRRLNCDSCFCDSLLRPSQFAVWFTLTAISECFFNLIRPTFPVWISLARARYPVTQPQFGLCLKWHSRFTGYFTKWVVILRVWTYRLADWSTLPNENHSPVSK